MFPFVHFRAFFLAQMNPMFKDYWSSKICVLQSHKQSNTLKTILKLDVTPWSNISGIFIANINWRQHLNEKSTQLPCLMSLAKTVSIKIQNEFSLPCIVTLTTRFPYYALCNIYISLTIQHWLFWFEERKKH